MAMKKLFALLAAMLLFTISACTPGNGEPSKSKRVYKISTYNAADTLLYYQFYLYNSNNLLTTNTYYNASDELRVTVGFAYDSNDHVNQVGLYNASSTLVAYSQYSYNASNLLDRMYFYFPPITEPYFYIGYNYDADGKRLEGLLYNYPFTEVSSYWEMGYNTSGLTDKVTFYYQSGEIEKYIVYDYDAGGKVVSIWTYNASDILIKRSDITYDTDGYPIKQSSYAYTDGIAALSGYSIIEYEDGRGNYSLTAQSGEINDFYMVFSGYVLFFLDYKF